MAVDSSTWDGNRAMGMCSSAADYRSICAGEKTTGAMDERQHWALPHHYLGRGPNAAGTRNALARLPQTQDLKNRDAARRHLEAHMSEINPEASRRPPRDDLVRAIAHPDMEVRAADGEPPTLFGHFAVFNQWTEIDSLFEGTFLERIAPGSFKKTFRESSDQIRALFQHGRDPMMGEQILGIPSVLREDGQGAYYEVPLFDGIPPLVRSGLEAGAYGASFRFRVTKEEIREAPKVSDFNPKALPERTIREVEVQEFGPVTNPAYAGATAGVRSLTDEMWFSRLTMSPRRLSEVIDYVRGAGDDPHSDGGAEAEPHSTEKIPAGLELTREQLITQGLMEGLPLDGLVEVRPDV